MLILESTISFVILPDDHNVMFEIKGKYLTSRYYARKIPVLSFYIYEMSSVEKSSLFYKTIPFPTRLISLKDEFRDKYSSRLRKYLRQAGTLNMEIQRPEWIPDLGELYQPVIEGKGLNAPPIESFEMKPNYYYSVIHHPELGRLAAHLNIGDQEERRIFGYINASAFRSFTEKHDQQICSTANKYLYYQDMLYFKSLGYQYFDMVGINEPMNQMKKQFGGEISMTYTHVPYILYFLQKIWNWFRQPYQYHGE